MAGANYNWKVGQRARVIYTRSLPQSCWQPGTEVQILAIYSPDQAVRYDADCSVLILSAHGYLTASPLFKQLQPLEDTSSWDDVEASTGWKPGKVREDKKEIFK